MAGRPLPSPYVTPWWLAPFLEFLAGLWTGSVVTLMVHGARELARLRAKVPANCDNFVCAGCPCVDGCSINQFAQGQGRTGEHDSVGRLPPSSLWASGEGPSENRP